MRLRYVVAVLFALLLSPARAEPGDAPDGTVESTGPEVSGTASDDAVQPAPDGDSAGTLQPPGSGDANAARLDDPPNEDDSGALQPPESADAPDTASGASPDSIRSDRSVAAQVRAIAAEAGLPADRGSLIEVCYALADTSPDRQELAEAYRSQADREGMSLSYASTVPGRYRQAADATRALNACANIANREGFGGRGIGVLPDTAPGNQLPLDL